MPRTVKATEKSGKCGFLGDPTEVALVEAGQKVPGFEQSCTFLAATRSRSTRRRKRLSTLHETPRGPDPLHQGGARDRAAALHPRAARHGVEPVTRKARPVP